MTYEQAMARDLAAPFDALVLPGGHAKGMRPYLESTVLQNLVARFFAPQAPGARHRPVAAVCQGCYWQPGRTIPVQNARCCGAARPRL